MWQRGTSWGGLTTSSQVGLPTCATMPWLMGTQSPIPVGCSPGGWACPLLLSFPSSCRQELGFLPKGLLWAPPASPGLCRGNPGQEDPLQQPPATH